MRMALANPNRKMKAHTVTKDNIRNIRPRVWMESVTPLVFCCAPSGLCLATIRLGRRPRLAIDSQVSQNNYLFMRCRIVLRSSETLLIGSRSYISHSCSTSSAVYIVGYASSSLTLSRSSRISTLDLRSTQH